MVVPTVTGYEIDSAIGLQRCKIAILVTFQTINVNNAIC
jgi:hypothetical protein